MNLPLFLQPSTALVTPLEDNDTVAYRALLGRWLIDLALLLGWDRPVHRRHWSHAHCCWENREFMALTGLAEATGEAPA